MLHWFEDGGTLVEDGKCELYIPVMLRHLPSVTLEFEFQARVLLTIVDVLLTVRIIILENDIVILVLADHLIWLHGVGMLVLVGWFLWTISFQQQPGRVE
jgi:hypothetical protein